MVGAIGCDGSLEAGGTTAAQCAYLMEYDGRTYLDADAGGPYTDTEFTVGKHLGTGLLPACNDTGRTDGTEKSEKVAVYEVEGIDPAVAVAAGTTPDEARLVAVRGADPTLLNALVVRR